MTNDGIDKALSGAKTALTKAVPKDAAKPSKEVPAIVKAGETVAPPVEQKGGRVSEYRKVFLARRQSRQGGGNTPAKGEQHDAAKG